MDKWRDLVHNMGIRVMVSAREHLEARVTYGTPPVSWADRRLAETRISRAFVAHR